MDLTPLSPVPAWPDPQPHPSWIINEYRIYCNIVDTNEAWVTSVVGYDIETYAMSGITAGMMECYMTSFSEASGTESAPSNTVSKMIYQEGAPNPPPNFDFSQAFRALIVPQGQ